MASSDLEKSAAFDDVDFTSGFETQYEQEYRPLKPKIVAPSTQDPDTLWYRDSQTIIMLSFLVVIIMFGFVLLTTLVFTSNPLYVLAITSMYIVLATVMIIIEVKSIHVR